jgi:hypothetical protein
VLFGAELSKVYSSNVGEYARQHLPATFEKIVEPIENAGERIEQATKDEFEPGEKSKKEK